MIRASLYAVAVMAFASPRRAAIRRKNAPSALWERCRFFAASRNACAARFTPGRVALDFSFPPDFFGFGARPSQLPKCFSLGHRCMSVPVSLKTTRAVRSSIPSIAVIWFSFFDYTFVVCRAVWTACTKYAKPVNDLSAA